MARLQQKTKLTMAEEQAKNLSGADRANDVPTAMVVDPAGGMYVTGYSKSAKSGYDFLTIKYGPDGDVKWAQRYDGPAKGDDRPTAIVLDSAGDIYVTGASAGEGTGSDYLTVKYGPGGDFKWAKRYNGTGDGFDRPAALALDPAGNVCVTGYSLGKATGYDCVTLKYDPDGNQLWVRAYNGPANEDDFGEAVRADANGNIYIAGYSRATKKRSNFLILKYDGAGKLLWTKTFDGGHTQDARANGLEILRNGQICVTGYVSGAHGLSDIFALCLDSNGKVLWRYHYDGAAQGEDKPTGTASDVGGDVLIIGASQGPGGSGKDFVTIKLGPDGKPRWERRYNGEGDGDDIPTSVATSADGASVVTGASQGINSGSDFLTVKYGPDGKELWAKRYNGEANDVDHPIAVGLDASGAVYVAGASWGGKDNGFDFVAIKYSADGTQQWLRRFDGAGKSQLQ